MLTPLNKCLGPTVPHRGVAVTPPKTGANTPTESRGETVGPGEMKRAQLQRALAKDGAAPAGPGNMATWTDANKDGMGTSHSRKSKVWFTIADGRMTEVFYPTVDRANTRELKFVVSDGKSFAVADNEAGKSHVEVMDDSALAFRYVTEDKKHGWVMTKSYITDPDRNTVMVDVDFKSTTGKPLDVYVLHDPAMNNSGRHDNAYVSGDALVASEGDVASALTSSIGFEEADVGFSGTSDGMSELSSKFKLLHHFDKAEDGNVVQLAKVTSGEKGHFTLALGFGSKPEEATEAAHGSLGEGFKKVYDHYVGEWNDYVGSLKKLPTPSPEHEKLLKMSAMVLAGLEDKTHPGAMIASLSVPWGAHVNANESGAGGYHLVWARDLYQAATALFTLGDKATANRALDFMFDTQYRKDSPTPRNSDGTPNPWLSDPEGAQAQNRWVDGRPYWEKLQMDQVALPVVLAYELDRTDAKTYQDHIKPAAEFLAKRGPFTQQERWEEQQGLSPSTVAAEIAGLVCAARIAEQNGDSASSKAWLAKADEWNSHLEDWMVTRRGSFGDGQYYIRSNPDWDPNNNQDIDLKNGGRHLPEQNVVDQGFLELVRLGIKSGKDPIIQKSIKVIDDVLRVETPNGPGFYRYNGDGYGEKANGLSFFETNGSSSGYGRLWPLLNGERALADVAAGNTQDARKMVDAMVGFANEGRQLPEQVWDRPTVAADEMNAGRAAWELRDNLQTLDQAAGLGARDGKFGVADLQAVAKDQKQDPKLRKAANYVLEHKDVLNEFDANHGKGAFAEIGWNQLNQAIDNHQPDFAPEYLKFGEGTHSATALAWSHAEYIMASAALATGKIPGQPDVVAEHFLGKQSKQA